jgi:hypothetical protein
MEQSAVKGVFMNLLTKLLGKEIQPEYSKIQVFLTRLV